MCCCSPEHIKWDQVAAEAIAVKSFLDCQSKTFKADVAKILKADAGDEAEDDMTGKPLEFNLY